MKSVETIHNKISDSLETDDAMNLGNVIFMIMTTAATIATFHYFLISIMRTYMFLLYKERKNEMLKIAYQCTNLTVNLCLGLFGLYHYSYLSPISTVPIEERISGYEEYDIFGAIQVGYNLWALPIGAYFVGEKKEMLIHHIFVIVVGSTSVFSRNGFRYHAPFFFGVIEISSVPLALWNFTKSNPDLAEKYLPKLARSPFVFIILFLVTRIFLWTPQMLDVLTLAGILYGNCTAISCKVLTSAFLVSSVMLSILQYYWAYLIVKGLVRRLKTMNKDR